MADQIPESRASAIVFAAGLVMMAVMAFLTAWPDMEASVFDSGTSAISGVRLRGLQCPMAIATDESAAIRASFANRVERQASFLVRARVSQGYVLLVREDSELVQLAPGDERTLAWPIAAKDAAYGRIVLARVLATRSADAPARQNSCGILVLGLRGVSGDSLIWTGIALAVALVALGGGRWLKVSRPLSGQKASAARSVAVLTALVAASLATGIAGLWLPSHVVLVFAGLFLVILVERRLGT